MSNAAKAVKVIRAILGGAAVAAIMSAPAHAGNPTPPPLIDIEKSINGFDADTPATALNVDVGDPLNYTFTVRNTGFNPFDFTVQDTEFNLSSVCTFPLLGLGLGLAGLAASRRRKR